MTKKKNEASESNRTRGRKTKNDGAISKAKLAEMIREAAEFEMNAAPIKCSVVLDMNLYRRFEMYAESYGKTLSEVANEAIKEHFFYPACMEFQKDFVYSDDMCFSSLFPTPEITDEEADRIFMERFRNFAIKNPGWAQFGVPSCFEGEEPTDEDEEWKKGYLIFPREE